MADLFIQITVSTPYDTDEYPVEYRILDEDRQVLYDWQSSNVFPKPDPSEHPDIYVQVRQPIDDDIVCVSEEHVVLETQITGGLLVIGTAVIDYGQPKWLHSYEFFDYGPDITNVAIHPTRRLVAICAVNGDHVQIYNFTTEAGEEPLFTHTSGFRKYGVCFGLDHFYVLEKEGSLTNPTHVRCFSLDDYSEVWHTEIEQEFRQLASGIDLSPDGNRLMFMGRVGIGSTGEAFIVELSPVTGEEVNSWVFADTPGGWIQFDLNGDIITVQGSTANYIRSIRKHDRSDPNNILWENDFGGSLGTTNATYSTTNACVDLNNDIIFSIRYSDTNEQIIKVDGATGQKLWSVQPPSTSYQAQGVGVDEQNNVYSIFASHNNTRFAIHDPDGNELFWGEVENEQGNSYNAYRDDYHIEVFPGRFQSPVYRTATFIPPLDRPALFYSSAEAQWSGDIDAAAGQISLDPPHELDFGEVEEGDDVVEVVTIKNSGGETISGDVQHLDDGQFSIISGSGNFTLGSGETREVVIRYTAQIGPKTGWLQINHDAGNRTSPIDYPLRGAGTHAEDAQISLNPANELHFGDPEQGEEVVETLDIKNTGDSPLIGAVQLSDYYFSIISGGGNFALDPGESKEVVIRYTSAGGPVTAWLHISHNDPTRSDPIEYPLRAG